MENKYQTEKEINGWFYEHEGQLYNYLAKLFVNKNIIEIGSHQGLSLSYIENTKNTIFGVEPNIKHFKILQENISKFNNKKIKIFNEPSLHVCKKFPNEFFNMVFIDANHDFNFVKNDIVFWTKKLKKYSILAGHDYIYSFMGVVNAVNQIVKKENITVVGRIWYTFWDGEKYCKLTEEIKNKFLIKFFKLN